MSNSAEKKKSASRNLVGKKGAPWAPFTTAWTNTAGRMSRMLPRTVSRGLGSSNTPLSSIRVPRLSTSFTTTAASSSGSTPTTSSAVTVSHLAAATARNLNGEPERARAVAEPAPRPLEPSGWPEPWLGMAYERHPHLRRPAFPLRQPLQQGWPLEAVVLTTVVHDVQPVPPFRRAEDGHVGERERHPLEAARRHEHLVRLQQLHGRRALLRGRDQPALQARRAGQTRLQAIGEVMRQPLGGVPCRRRVPLDLLQEFAGAPAVARCHRLRARHEQLAQVHHLPFGLPPPPPRRLPALLLRGDARRVRLLVPVEHHLLQHLADAIVVVLLLLRRGHQFARPAHLGLQLVPAMLTTLPSPTIAAPLHHQGSRILHGCTVHLTGDAGGGGEDLGERLLRLEESGVVGVQAEEHVVVDVLLHENTRDVREHHIVGRRGGFGRRRGWPHELQQRSAARRTPLITGVAYDVLLRCFPCLHWSHRLAPCTMYRHGCGCWH
ncbi:Os11g0139550 [Oryza sativa Japonica Group]|uniref:Os11g0139550 protein n=1 Tax=Oryza sativa subsp. japonica TaxID=39947 RepID=A0A0P0XZ46_ORYSJ|nr:Os11g0139550 [Oryza sativa Japonica Group]